MPYYKFELTGGERHERNAYAEQYDLRPSDYTGHAIVFYKEHPAKLDQLRRSHSAIAGDLKVKITKISKAIFEGS